jgi:hypothetical protein
VKHPVRTYVARIREMGDALRLAIRWIDRLMDGRTGEGWTHADRLEIERIRRAANFRGTKK